MKIYRVEPGQHSSAIDHRAMNTGHPQSTMWAICTVSPLHFFSAPSPPLPPPSSSPSPIPLPLSFSPLHFSCTFFFPPLSFSFLFPPPFCVPCAEVEGFFYSVVSLLHVVPADMTEQFVDLLCQKVSAGANHDNGLFKLKL